jgi:hypothetical protein
MDGVTDFLSRDERVLWTGTPQQGLPFTSQDWFILPFSLFWCGFVAFWEMQAVKSGPFFFELWGLPFIAVGIYMLAGRFLVDAWVRRGTLYTLTNKRILIQRSPPFSKLITL